MLKTILGTSPRTTIMGYLTAIGIGIYPVFSKEGFDLQKDWKLVVAAGIVAVWGRLQKDSNGVTATQGKELVQNSNISDKASQ